MGVLLCPPSCPEICDPGLGEEGGGFKGPLGWGWGHPAGKGRWKSELSHSWHLQSQNSEALAPSSWALRQGQSSLLFLPSGYMRTGD